MMRAALLAAAACAAATAARSQPLLFVYTGAGCTGRSALPAFEAFAGREVDGVVDFLAAPTWDEELHGVDWHLGCWAPLGRRLVLGVPMLTSDGTTSLAQGAQGAYDARFRALGERLVGRGRPDAYLRIGAEFNGDWYPWSAAKDPAAFRLFFRRIVQALRSTPGARFTIVWNPSLGADKVAADDAYPGDDVVDLIGLDVYDQSWRPQDRNDPETRWRGLLSAPYGLDWATAFARRHGKRLAVPEWGTGVRPDGHGFADDPVFVERMGAWIAANDVVLHGYWDYAAPDFDAQLSTGRQPRAAAAFKAALAQLDGRER